MLMSSEVIKNSGIQFGTSGARGLVSQFTSNVCAAFSHAFISCMKNQFSFTKVAIAIDNRPSSLAMAQACAKALKQQGLQVVYYGVVPTPALAYVSIQDDMPAIMVTGSHIPHDRNGLKFYRPDGEICKADESAILQATVEFEAITELSALEVETKAATAYIERYTSLFDKSLLAGKRIGIYEHSSAGRDLYVDIFTALGAEVIALARSDEFVPIDTEAVSVTDKQRAKLWSQEYNLECIFSTDGDGDRPLVADENGDWLRGDVLGLLCADALKVTALAVPVSCNTAIESCQRFSHVTRTKIGSPYVIAEFNHLAKTYSSVAGFEANGGFILGSDTEVNNEVIKSLPTRDAVLPALMLLAAAKETAIFEMVHALPQRFSHSDCIKNISTEISNAILARAHSSPAYFLRTLGFTDIEVETVDITDGVRIILRSGNVIHIRPSGNAPELRCYAESSDFEHAQHLVNHALTHIHSIYT